MSNLPIACSLDPAALDGRRQGLLAELLRQATHTESTADGYLLQFDASADALASIVRAVDAERVCCRFLRFQLTIEPDEGPISLQLTGPAGTREFLAGLFEV